MYTTLVDTQILQQNLADADWLVVDCRFDLADTAAGQKAYALSHIPGAVYAHLDDDLSGPPVTDHGRHPLPTPEALTTLFSRLGIDEQKQVVVYDGLNGGLAARLWWMLRYMGHTAVAVLDGGWDAWQDAGLPTQSGVVEKLPAIYSGRPRREWLVTMDMVVDAPLLVDSRDGARYRGELEPLDPMPGHIPGAAHFYYRRNWDENGRYLPTERMRGPLLELLGDHPANEVVFYCGSGVTACVNLLAMAHTGLGDGHLYVGSWSEWCSYPENQIATGDEG